MALCLNKFKYINKHPMRVYPIGSVGHVSPPHFQNIIQFFATFYSPLLTIFNRVISQPRTKRGHHSRLHPDSQTPLRSLTPFHPSILQTPQTIRNISQDLREYHIKRRQRPSPPSRTYSRHHAEYFATFPVLLSGNG